MLISHKHKFIFIKTRKTAGTSVEIALSQFCGDHDVITPIGEADEKIRREFGFRGPQNYRIGLSAYSMRDSLRAVARRKRVAFYNHAPAAFVMRYVDNDVWNSYYKFCFDRNPWDKVISWYYWQKQSHQVGTLSEFVHSGQANSVQAFSLYTVNSEVVVDRVCRFESIEEEMEHLAKTVNLPEVPKLPRAKASVRQDKRSYRELMSEADRDKIAKVFAREIAHFGYQW